MGKDGRQEGKWESGRTNGVVRQFAPFLNQKPRVAEVDPDKRYVERGLASPLPTLQSERDANDLEDVKSLKCYFYRFLNRGREFKVTVKTSSSSAEMKKPCLLATLQITMATHWCFYNPTA